VLHEAPLDERFQKAGFARAVLHEAPLDDWLQKAGFAQVVLPFRRDQFEDVLSPGVRAHSLQKHWCGNRYPFLSWKAR
jgi:hypothetical protein